MAYHNLEAIKPKSGPVDQLLVEFDKLQGAGFCFGIREMAYNHKDGKLVTGFLVLEGTIWDYVTVRSPEAFAEIIKELNKPGQIEKSKLVSMARKVNLYLAERIPNTGTIPVGPFLPTKETALVLALCRHLEDCSRPGTCGWDFLLGDLD